MAQDTISYFDAAGNLVRQETVQIPDPPVDPIQAQIDALTNAMLA